MDARRQLRLRRRSQARYRWVTGSAVTWGYLARSVAAKCVEKDDGEEEKRQAELRRCEEQILRLLEEEDYAAVAAVQKNIAALMWQGELRLAQDQLKKLLEEEDYTGAAAVKESIAAFISAEPCSQRNHGRSTADWSAVLAAGHGSQTATGPIVSSATFARHADAKRVGGEKEEKRRAELLRAQEQLKKCLEEEDYRGAAAAK